MLDTVLPSFVPEAIVVPERDELTDPDPVVSPNPVVSPDPVVTPDPATPTDPVVTPDPVTPTDPAKDEAYAAIDYLANLIKTDGSKADAYFQAGSRKNDLNSTIDNGGPNFGAKIDNAMDASTTDAIDGDNDGFSWTMARDSKNDENGHYDFSIYWYGKSIDELNTGDVINNVFRYKGNTGDAENNVEDNTVEGSANVKEKTVDNHDFNVIVEGSFTETTQP